MLTGLEIGQGYGSVLRCTKLVLTSALGFYTHCFVFSFFGLFLFLFLFSSMICKEIKAGGVCVNLDRTLFSRNCLTQESDLLGSSSTVTPTPHRHKVNTTERRNQQEVELGP